MEVVAPSSMPVSSSAPAAKRRVVVIVSGQTSLG
jgi:hypothetical protein